MYVANTRSRNYKSGRQTEPLEIGFNIAGIEEYVATPQEQCEHIAKATESDMNSVCWKKLLPADSHIYQRSSVPDAIQIYWNHKDELLLIDSRVIKRNKRVIPKVLRGNMLEVIHESHLGIVKCKAWRLHSGRKVNKMAEDNERTWQRAHCWINRNSQRLKSRHPVSWLLL